MNYKSYGDLSLTINNNLHKIPRDSNFKHGVKRILFVNHNLFPFEASGTPLSTRNHALGMSRRGMEVAVLIPDASILEGYTKKNLDGFTLYQIPAMHKLTAYFAMPGRNGRSQCLRTLEQVIDDFSPQIVHINDYVYLPAEIIETFSGKGCIVVREVCNCEEFCHRDCPVIFSGLDGRLCSGPESPHKCATCFSSPSMANVCEQPLLNESLMSLEEVTEHRFKYVMKLYQEAVDGIIFTSEPFKTYFCRFAQIPDDKISIIPRGFAFDFARSHKPKRPAGKVKFAFVGNIMFSKGIDVALRAFEKICNEHDFVLHIYGAMINPEYQDWIKRSEAEHPDKLIHHGPFSADDISNIALNIDVCIVPSYFDTYNRVVREMLYLGIPVITTDFFGAYVVEDGKNGLRIPVGNSDALAEKMMDIINNPSMIEKLSCGADQTEIPTLEEEIDKLIETYNDLYSRALKTTKSGLNKIVAFSNEQSAIQTARLIAFYLPQYHPIQENDRWWGKGFTEWTNVTKAKPFFPGHQQPHLPGELGFYDLRLAENRKAQADLAKAYGIDGFCYYHYWFSGKRLLDYPLQQILKSGEPDFPFCLCWANENWTRVWDGGQDEILMEQRYSDADDQEHIRFLCEIFRDRRYIRIEGKPLFLIYRAQRLPNPEKTITLWRKEARRCGIGELYLCRVESFPDEHNDPETLGFDAAVEFQPDWSLLSEHLRDERVPHLTAYHYSKVIDEMLRKERQLYRRFPCVTPGWDNTARRGTEGLIFTNSTPELYGYWLRETIAKQQAESETGSIVFINAWNEWAEGNYLEPNQVFGRAYLEATKRAINEALDKQQGASAAEEHSEASNCLVKQKHVAALSLAKEGRSDEAIESLASLVVDHPQYALAYNDLGVLYTDKGDYEKALTYARLACQKEPANYQFRKNLADLLYVALKRTEEALQIYLELLKLNPEDTEVLTVLGRICIELSDYQTAKDFYRKVTELEPENQEAQHAVSTLCSTGTDDHDSFSTQQPGCAANSLSRPEKTSGSRTTSQGLVCVQPFYLMEFATSGHVYTCCPAWTKLSIGHIGQESMAGIWNSGPARQLRRMILSGRFNEVCNEICPHIAEHRHTGKLISLDRLEGIEALTPDLVAEIRSGHDLLRSSPTVFNLSNSTVCNLSCIMCSRLTDPADPGLVQKTARELETFLPGAKRIILSGMGDPFARPDTRSIMLKYGGTGPVIDLITNGLLLPKYWQEMQSCLFGNLLISVDAANQQTYEKIRRGGTWRDLLISLDLVHANRQRFQSVTLNMTVMRSNMNSIPAFIDFAESYNYDVSFQRIRGHHDDQNIFEMHDTHALNALARMVSAEKKRERRINVYWADLLEFVTADESPAPVRHAQGVTAQVYSDGRNTSAQHHSQANVIQRKKENQIQNARECRQESTVLKSGPLTAIVSMGSRCNLRCQMCHRTIHRTKGVDMPRATFEKTRAFFPTLQRIKLIGAGEPFLNPDYFNMLAMAKTYALAVETVSNGTLLSDATAKEVVMSGLDSLCISLDGATSGTYESIRRGSQFKQVVEGIERVNLYKRHFGSHSPVMGLSTVIMRRNVEELPALVELASRLRLSWVTVLYMTVFTPELIPESLFFHQKLSDGMLLEAQERARQLGVAIDVPGLFSSGRPSEQPLRRKQCFEPWQMALVETGGEVMPCCTYGEALGNLNDTEFFDIWNNARYQDLRRRVNSDDPPEPCKYCSNSTVAHSVHDIESHIRCPIPPEYQKLTPRGQINDAHAGGATFVSLYQSEETPVYSEKRESDPNDREVVNCEKKITPASCSAAPQSSQTRSPTVGVGAKHSVSIIIPQDQCHAVINACTEAILENTNYSNYEIIIVCQNASSTAENEVSGQENDRIKIFIPWQATSITAGCNMAAEGATGEYLLFLDPRIIVSKGWLNALMRTSSAEAQMCAVTPKIITPDNTIHEAGYSFVENLAVHGYGEQSVIDLPVFNYARTLPGGSRYCMLLPKHSWNAAGGFDTRLEDFNLALMDMALSLRRSGVIISYQPYSSALFQASTADNAPSSNDSIHRQELIERLRPTIFRPLNGKSDETIRARKRILVLGIYLANKWNNTADIVSIFSSSKKYDVVQRWIALGGPPPSPEVAAVTVSTIEGRKPKFQIINEVMAKEDMNLYEYVILADDDIVLPHDFVDQFITLQHRLDFALAQPARTSNSYIDHPIVERQNGLIARRTKFVEIGPIVSFHQSAYELLFPFHLASPMGWGYENVWAALLDERGMRMGIIDNTPVDHSLRKPVENYDWSIADRQRNEFLSKNRHIPLDECFTVLEAIASEGVQ